MCGMSAKSCSTADRLEAIVRERLARQGPAKPLIVGTCGSQGSGKSTACARVAHALSASGIRVAILSIDDLYLPRIAREHLARRVHPLLVTRGVPGTHEISLGLRTLDALATHTRASVPRFDKSRDDREPESRWDVVDAPVDVVLFEGWCVGARPEPPDMLDVPVNALEAREDADGRWRRYVNDALSGAYQQLFARIDLLVLLAAPGFEIVVRWRMEQERRLRDAHPGAAGVMADAAIQRFVQHYERLTRHILREMPSRADHVLSLDENRTLVS
jgi:D-glycerate 3-kinase